MRLSELLCKAAELRATENRPAKVFSQIKEVFSMGKSTKCLVAIPNKIRKRFSGAAR